MFKFENLVDNLKLSKTIINFSKPLTCIVSKQTRKHFTGTRTRATKPLQIVHTDVCGPVSPQTWTEINILLPF